MNLTSDILIYIITFYILVQLDLFERNTKNDMIFIGKNFAIYVITYQIISYLIKRFAPLKEGHETPCTIVYGEPGTDVNNWATANLSSNQREENHCYYNLETETWDSNPQNTSITDRTICACRPDGGHRHFGDELESIMHCFEPEEELNMIFTGENTRGNDNFDIQAVCQDGYGPLNDVAIDVSCPYPGGSDYTIQGECVEMLCQAPDNIGDVVIQGDLTPSSFSATGECPSGFEGDVTISGCEIGGEPYTIDSNCVEQQCISPTNIGIIDPATITESDLYRSTWNVTASCPDGYSGTPTITECSIGGTEYTIDDSSCIPNVNCQGTWSTCSVACESGANRTYTVTQPQSGDGVGCPAQGDDCQPGEGECPEMCLTPSSLPNIDVQETDLSRLSFSAISQCSDGYTGSLTTSPCTAHGEEYQIQGECVQNLDCQGEWSTCTTECETADQRTFSTTQEQSGAGAACSVATDCEIGQGTCAAEPTEPEPAVGEPFVVMPPDELLQNVGDTVSCDETCGYHGLTCVNSIGTENRFQGNTDRNSDGYANEVANYITNIPEPYRNNIIHESLSNPNQIYWISSNGAPGNLGQNEIAKRLPADDPNGKIYLGDMINDRDAVGSLTCDGGDRSRGQVSSFVAETLVRTIPCFCQQPGGSAVPPTCVPPADIVSFNIQDPPSDADLTIDNFDVTLQCADGFTGTATATACSADGEEYTITSDCAAESTEPEPTSSEPFFVMSPTTDPDEPGYGDCDDVCTHFGFTCAGENDVDFADYFEENGESRDLDPYSDTGKDLIKQAISEIPPEYRQRASVDTIINIPNSQMSHWTSYQARPRAPTFYVWGNGRTDVQPIVMFNTRNERLEVGGDQCLRGQYAMPRTDATNTETETGGDQPNSHHYLCSCQQP